MSSEQQVAPADVVGSVAPREITAGDVAAVASVVALVAAVAVLGNGLWFFSDDWNILVDYHDGHLLQPFNNHLSLVPAGTYDLLFHTVGLGSYVPYRIVGMAGMAILGVATWRYSRNRVGPWGAALATTAVIWGSGGATDLMFPFLVNFSLPLALLAIVWICMDRHTSRSDVAAAGALAVALATSGLGVLVAAAVVVELALRRAPWRRWLPFAVPMALWCVWYAGHRVSTPGDVELRPMLSYAARMLWGGTTALAAGWKPGGAIVAAVLAGYFAVATLRWRSVDARTIAALAAPLLFVALTAYTRLGVVPAIPPDEFRYRWTIAAFLVFAIVSAWRQPHPPLLPAILRPAAAIAVILVVFAGAAIVVRDAHRWAEMVRAAAPGLRVELFAAEAVGDRVEPDHVLPLSYVPVTLGGYLAAVADVGSPLDGHLASGYGGSVEHRRSADRLLALLPARPGTDASTDCAPIDAADLRVAPGTTVIVSAAPGATPTATMARFGDRPLPVEWLRRVEDTWQVRVPRDAHARVGAPAYRLTVDGRDGETVTVCRP